MSILLIGDMFGLIPSEKGAVLDARKKLSESPAVQFSAAINMKDIDVIVMSIDAMVDRNDDILSAALINASKEVLISSGEHDRHWMENPDDRSSATHILVPIFIGDERWGTVQLRFSPLPKDSLFGLSIDSIILLVVFVAISGFTGYFLLLRRILRYLAPSSVVPERVKKAFSVLAEGVLIMDENEKIVAVNQSFIPNVGRVGENLLGRTVSDFNWIQIDENDSAEALPWLHAMETRKTLTATALMLDTPMGVKTFMVNVTPILDEKNSKSRGALATFDDVTLMEKRNTELNMALKMLKLSQQRISEKKRELEFLATRDTLTGSLNRRAFLEAFETAFVQAQEQGTRLSCIMTDIDHFKSINDRYGHAAGDKVTKTIAGLLQSKSRDVDVVGRYGGEEFCIFLPGLDLDKAWEVAERIRTVIETSKQMLLSSQAPITASSGISSLAFSAMDPLELVNQADKALYVAKDNGRNQVVKYSKAVRGYSQLKKDSPQTSTETLTPSTTNASRGDSGSDAEHGRELLALQKRIKDLENAVSLGSDELQHQSLHDKLTGLPNQALFLDRVQQAIRRCRRTKGIIAVLSIGIDRFSRVNKSMGPLVGDQLIKKISKRLESAVRKMDTISTGSMDEEGSTVSRFGGDEFNILLSDLESAESVTLVANRINEVLSNSIELDEKKYFFTVTIGISLHPHDGETPNILIRNAVAARSHARELDMGGKYQFYSDDLNRDIESSLQIESQLHSALDNDEFLLHYQPKVNSHSGGIIGMEALLRWHNPETDFMVPGQFIPIAERTGIITSIGRQVLRMACMQARAWLDQGLLAGHVGVNLSALQLREDDIVLQVIEALEEARLDPSYLDIELTESAVIADFDSSVKKLNELRAHGVTISLDDFGTGYSSLSYMRELPVDTLKIDRSFIQNITVAADDLAIVTSVVALAHNLGLKVVAEGIETPEQRTQICRMNCDGIQGFLFSKPVPASEATLLLKSEHLGSVSLAEVS
ncbi:MAG: diguanylate cyclase [Gammaproteobacteria bacterium]|nr:diguanylate cyclase [Gammaproteobacteria bacterium]